MPRFLLDLDSFGLCKLLQRLDPLGNRRAPQIQERLVEEAHEAGIGLHDAKLDVVFVGQPSEDARQSLIKVRRSSFVLGTGEAPRLARFDFDGSPRRFLGFLDGLHVGRQGFALAPDSPAPRLCPSRLQSPRVVCLLLPRASSPVQGESIPRLPFLLWVP